MTQTVTFPGLGLELELNRVAFTLLGRPVYWYGVIIALGFLLAVAFCCRRAKRFGVESDDLIDMLIFAVPLGILGARLYYIIFEWNNRFVTAEGRPDWGAMLRIWDGGLAIYGGVIAAVLTVVVFCKVRRLKLGAFVDVGAYGLLIGQAVGRWGNFVNVECFGADTTLPWRMGVEVWDAAAQELVYHEVHPTFLYESLWNLAGFFLLLAVARWWRKFDGQIFLSYILWYGLGRAWVEGLRTDSLYFFGTGIRTSQALAALSAAVALVCLIYHLAVKKHTPDELLVNQLGREEGEEHDDPGREGPGGEDQEQHSL